MSDQERHAFCEFPGTRIRGSRVFRGCRWNGSGGLVSPARLRESVCYQHRQAKRCKHAEPLQLSNVGDFEGSQALNSRGMSR